MFSSIPITKKEKKIKIKKKKYHRNKFNCSKKKKKIFTQNIYLSLGEIFIAVMLQAFITYKHTSVLLVSFIIIPPHAGT